jgi:hypothetical protein
MQSVGSAKVVWHSSYACLNAAFAVSAQVGVGGSG